MAQQGRAVLQGTVTDKNTGVPIAGVDVRVTSPALQGERGLATDEAGRYRIPNLPPGDYTIRIQTPPGTYLPFEEVGVRLRADVTVQADIELVSKVDTGVEEIVVLGNVSTVDVGTAQNATNISAEFTRRVPIALPTGKAAANRSIESMALASPESKADRFGTSISGTSSPENSYIMDGFSIGDPSLGLMGTPLSMEFVKELNVITSGYMPEYGKTTGGVLNAVTKSGSNEFGGSAWSYFTPGTLQAQRKVVKAAQSAIVVRPELRWIFDVGADAGGALIKDKLWYYVGVDYARTEYRLHRSVRRSLYDDNLQPLLDEDDLPQREIIPGSKTRYTADANTLQFLSKLSYAKDDNNQFTLTFLASPTFSGGDEKIGINDRSGRFNQTLRGTIGSQALRYENNAFDTIAKWSLSSDDYDLLLDTTFGWHHQRGGRFPMDRSEPGSTKGLAGVPLLNWQRSSNPSGHSVEEFEDIDPSLCAPLSNGSTTVYPCEIFSYTTGGPGQIEDVKVNRFQLRSIGTMYVSRLFGSHVIKAGVDFELTEYERTRAYTGGHSVAEFTDGTGFYDSRQYGALQGPDNPDVFPKLNRLVRNFMAGGFVQDSWEVLDLFSLNFGLRYDAQYVFNNQDEVGIGLPNQFAPRVGTIWDPLGDGQAKLFANYATFYHSIPLRMSERFLSGEPMARSNYEPGSLCNPQAPNPEEGGCYNRSSLIARGGSYRPNRYWRHSNGLVPVDPEIQPQSSSEVSMGGEYNLFRTLRVGGVYMRRWMNMVIEDMSRDNAATYFFGNPGYGAAPDFPKAKRVYDAITLYGMKPFGRNWLAQVSYTLAWLRGNFVGLYRPETGQLDPNMNADFDLAEMLVNRDGPLTGDRRHTIKIFGAYDFALKPGMTLNVGTGVVARSGAPTDYLGAHKWYGDSEIFILPRGSGERLPWFYEVNLSLGYRINLTDTNAIDITADIFNLFNFKRVTAVDENYTYAAVLPIEDGDTSRLSELTDSGGDSLPDEDLNDNFGNPTAYQQPFTVRLGIRASF